jgi:SMC interacting uncharacterized protein involved in chromosome segregation
MFDFLFEEEAKKPVAKPASKEAPASASTVRAPMTSQFDSGPGVSLAPSFVPAAPVNDDLYNKLLDRTRLEGTQVFSQVNNFMRPLENIITDPNVRFKAGFAQAKSAGLDEDRFLGAFTDMSNSLENAKSSFEQTVEGQTQAQITGKQAAITKAEQDIQDLQKRIVELTTQRAQLQNEVSTSTTKIATVKAQFEVAYNRRKAEIDQQRLQYTGLLK